MLTRLRRFFRKPEQKRYAASYASICVAGDIYTRVGSDLTVMRWGSDEIKACGQDHVASNGVPVKQIAYAVALIEGSIAISDTIPVNSPFVGLN